MKNKKENKVQILAALALAMSLGLVVPNAAVFASDGTVEEEAGIEAQAEGAEAGGGTNADDKEDEVLDLDDSVAELYKRIQTNDSFKAYRDMLPLIENTQNIQDSVLLKNTKEWAQNTKYYFSGVEFTLWGSGLGDDTKIVVENLPVYKAISALKADKHYTSNSSVKAIVDSLESAYTTLQSSEVELVTAVFPELPNVDSMDLQELVNAVTKTANYAKYVALNNASAFLKNAVVTGEDGTSMVSIEALNTLFTESELMVNYSTMANAAVAIDKDAVNGLTTYKLPTTSVSGNEEEKPEVPDSGIVGLFEAGALDLGTVTLIVSVALASVAGLGLIAKLYLKHKF